MYQNDGQKGKGEYIGLESPPYAELSDQEHGAGHPASRAFQAGNQAERTDTGFRELSDNIDGKNVPENSGEQDSGEYKEEEYGEQPFRFVYIALPVADGEGLPTGPAC
jgi:hypothetical protein